MPNVSVPKSFFVKERRMYSNWQFAFWREFFQNSTDARASRIDVNIVRNGNDIIVEFSDNGCGMTREVLENVYFSLGSTTKTGGDTVGGFGRARLLTCFSMKNYTIHTLNNLVQGEGGSYEIAEVDPRQGCQIRVEIENENFDRLYNELISYLRGSHISCEVYINGTRFSEWNYRRQLTRELSLNNVPFAKVYVNKSAANNSLLIRVSGALMYSQLISARAQVIVEIDSTLSRNVLTANRDGMQSEYAAVLHCFIEELSVDTLSALKTRFKKKSGIVRGKGFMFSVSKDAATKLSQNGNGSSVDSVTSVASNSGNLVNTGVYLRSSTEQGVAARLSAILNTKTHRVAEVIGGTLEVSSQAIPVLTKNNNLLDVGDPYYKNLPDIFIEDETSNEKIRKVIDQYNPDNWVVAEQYGKRFNKGSKMHKLIMLWKVACQEAINAMMRKHPQISQVVWGIGWIFCDDNCEARHMKVDGGSVFLLNPVGDDGILKYSIRDSRSQKILMALAKHEVAHTIHSYHNEEYASLLTDIDEEFDEREVYRLMRDTLSAIN